MSTNFPTSLDTLTNPGPNDLVENANSALDHDLQHANANDAIEALEAKVGINSSAVTTSHDYKLGEVTGSDRAVGKTATQTLTNKTLTSPTLTTPVLGTPASGTLTNCTGLPEAGITLSDNTTNDVSTTKHGFTPKAPNDTTKFLRGDATWSVPSVSAATGVDNHDISSTTQKNMAHGLGVTPTVVDINFSFYSGSAGDDVNYGRAITGNGGTNWRYMSVSVQTSTGTHGQSGTNVIIYKDGSNSLSITASVDSTNITLSFSKSGTPTGTMSIIWLVIR